MTPTDSLLAARAAVLADLHARAETAEDAAAELRLALSLAAAAGVTMPRAIEHAGHAHPRLTACREAIEKARDTEAPGMPVLRMVAR